MRQGGRGGYAAARCVDDSVYVRVILSAPHGMPTSATANQPWSATD
ncbi:hypothetical protein [Streptomyces ipomoeae]|nr:hypothetical protein [Streptomyces ipomoeae]